ncbi:MAG: hypothetical protein GX166_14110 [Clostridiaceae bacterium]|nr:hypothetical protein [Clostridiaceae bacterium]
MFKKGIVTVFIAVILCVFMSFQSFAALYELKVTLDDEVDGTSLREVIDLLDVFEFNPATPTSDATVESDGDNKYITTTGYLDVTSWDYITGPYTFSVDYRIVTETENVGFFVRGVYPSSFSKINPQNHGVDQQFGYYEWDWYKENGGQDGVSGIGGSGIVVTPKKTELLIRIKNWKPDGLNISSERVSIPLPEDVDNNAFNTISFKDDGEKKVEIFFNDILMATVEFSEPGVYEEDEEDDNEYFKNAVVKDAEGNELLSLDNARINAEGSQVAIGVRNIEFQFDNIYISYEVPDTPEPTDTPEPKETDTPAPQTTTPADNDETDKDKGGSILPFAIAGGAVVVIAVAAILIIISKKKK